MTLGILPKEIPHTTGDLLAVGLIITTVVRTIGSITVVTVIVIIRVITDDDNRRI